MLRDKDGNWNVPYANWNGSKWNRNANWLTNDWNSNYRVVLLDKLAGGKAKHDDVVELDGKKYKLRFKPIGKSRSGITVRVWGRAWQKVRGKPQ